MRVFSSLRPWESAGDPVGAIECLIGDLGLSRHPSIRVLWTAWRAAAASAGSGIEAAGGMASAGPRTPSAHARARLHQLGVQLLELRPHRAADVAAVWAAASVDLGGQLRVPVRLEVREASGGQLEVATPGGAVPLNNVLAPRSALRSNLLAAVRQLRPVDSLVVSVDLSTLRGDALDVADALQWEALLPSPGVAPAHLVREVAPQASPPAQGPIHTVGFLTAAASSAARERQWVAAAWGGRLQDGRTEADLVHVHAHGASGALSGIHAASLRAQVVVFNACEGAHDGGVVRAAVASGRARDAFGFTERVLASTTTTLSAVVHPLLQRWSAHRATGLELAGVAGRAVMGAQPGARSWRHYRVRR